MPGPSKVSRLRRSKCDGPGIVRQRKGSGFVYRYGDGTRVDDAAVLRRIKALVLPPAWTDVWICPWPNGHIQALGTDNAGRRQYRYHDDWRLQRDIAKHDRALVVAKALPLLRTRVTEGLASGEPSRAAVLAAAVRLLDLGFFRVGGEAYADEHNTYGLATLRKDHVSFDGDAMVFDYEAKGSVHRVVSIVDPEVRQLMQRLKRRRGGGAELLAYKDESSRWHDVRSGDINDHLRRLSGIEMTAKDFRTWHATVLMAVALAVSASMSVSVSRSAAARDRAVARAYREVSGYLGNTPAVCRKSYVDPRVVDRFDEGTTIAGVLEKLGSQPEYGLATQGPIEQAVVRLLAADGGRRKAGQSGKGG
ncbi:MAG: DNA topoisomerase IB [Acidothermaceae bacterium]